MGRAPPALGTYRHIRETTYNKEIYINASIRIPHSKLNNKGGKMIQNRTVQRLVWLQVKLDPGFKQFDKDEFLFSISLHHSLCVGFILGSFYLYDYKIAYSSSLRFYFLGSTSI